MPTESGETEALKSSANAFAASTNSDLIILNYEITTPIDFLFVQMVSKRQRRKNVVTILATEGGSADTAFRVMRCLQAHYAQITIVVAGWCKSAGTLMCVGANQLYISESGELGPLDVQIVKADELDEQKSGLVAEAAFQKLQQEAYKFFMSFVSDISASGYRVTLKTASDVAAKMTIGVMEPIFDKLDPVTIGEDFRSNKLAQAYAERLNVFGKNLVRTRHFDALETLLASYPSHGFVIDLEEAKTLFRRVETLPPALVEIVKVLGADAVYPRSPRQEQGPRLEYLNDEQANISNGKTKAARPSPSKHKPGGGRRDRGNNLPGNTKKSGSPASAAEDGTRPEEDQTGRR